MPVAEDPTQPLKPMRDAANAADGPDYSIPGMRIRAGRDGEPWALVVQSAERQSEWVEELATVVERISNPRTPTAIHYQDQYYRIDEVERTESGWTYRMTAWPDGEPRLHTFELDRAQIRADKIEKDLMARDVHEGRAAILWGWLLGWLPSPIQNDLAEHHNFSPADASRVQAFIQFIFMLGFTWAGTGGLFAGFHLGHTGPIGTLWFSFAMVAEGAIRYGHTLVTQEPCGFWPLELVHRLLWPQRHRP